MHLQWRRSNARISAVACAAAVVVVVASASAMSRGSVATGGVASGPAAGAPAPQASPAPQPSPSPAASAAPQETPAPPAATQEEPLPRIIRTVCTDHVCGGCDGKCRKSSGHVAVDKKGHCACTPAAGSALDRAVRQAYERRPPQ